MKHLSNGNRRSDITVFPANWRSKSASVRKDWRITYRFYSPTFPPKLVHIRVMNTYKELPQRQEATEAILRALIYDLDERGYNPNTGKFNAVAEDIHQNSSLLTSLHFAKSKLNYKPRTMTDVEAILRTVEKACKILVLDVFPVAEIRTKHIYQILDKCGQLNPRWSARRYNMYRAYLSKLFTIIKRMGGTLDNPVRDVEVMITETKIRTEIEVELRNKITSHLKTVDPAFLRFLNIFFHSGARISELMQLQVKNVELQNQRFKVKIEKGRQNKWVWKTIKNIALPYWNDAIGDADLESYVFSRGLVPGSFPIGQDVLNKRWRKHVKEKFNTDVEMYTLKHMNSTYIAEKLGDEAAAKMNSHTTTGMVINVYDINRMSRMHQFLKDLDNNFRDN